MAARALSYLALTLALAACDPDTPPSPPPAAAPENPSLFLDHHWQRPLAPQGEAPSRFGTQEASLDPAACGNCHTQQFADWQTSLHSRAMGPGLLGQLQEMDPDAVDEHQSCLRCHAPLAEQAEDLQHSLAGTVASLTDGAAFSHGLTCAACHVRGHRRFGPPRRDGSAPAADDALPHDGWQTSAAFEDARFCTACHQFEPDGYALEGKLLENTYEEWRASRHARENRPCQSCHMPDRRHLWRGIHDPDMVRSGISIDTTAPAGAAGRIEAELRITNHGVGHAFPTYVTPHVIVEIGQTEANGEFIPDTVERHLIARDVSLDLTLERADTRILPDELRRYGYDRPRHPRAAGLHTRIRVEPDAFYAAFYRTTLRQPGVVKGRETLVRALHAAERSGYVLYESTQALAASQ
ncbi:cytochrome c family protein [Denitromonas iodatirespirans]|uniref:Cytochrome c-552/4 domain-containing protein n=1 Tax=Denitromonas iodatirespirans TaxID=2795389 RepID=A0A944HBG3_DENI1|nr:cytochrome c family protein [Denitromonas iodatirespirans]MBT0960266.1 hypothetical protein [Denitromonas iodatirespirans]